MSRTEIDRGSRLNVLPGVGRLSHSGWSYPHSRFLSRHGQLCLWGISCRGELCRLKFDHHVTIARLRPQPPTGNEESQDRDGTSQCLCGAPEAVDTCALDWRANASMNPAKSAQLVSSWLRRVSVGPPRRAAIRCISQRLKNPYAL